MWLFHEPDFPTLDWIAPTSNAELQLNRLLLHVSLRLADFYLFAFLLRFGVFYFAIRHESDSFDEYLVQHARNELVGFSLQTEMAFGQYLLTMLGKELKLARLLQKMTQEELAHHANMDRSHISDLERDRKSPTVETLLRLCKALKISAAELIARVEGKTLRK